MSALTGPTLQAELLTTLSQLEQIAEPWWDLWQQCPAATPFQTPEWLLPWCRGWSAAGVHVLALWHGQRLVGLVPWRLDTDEAGRRRALLLGAGLSDYLDALVAPRWWQAAKAPILAHLAELRSRVGFSDAGPLAPDSVLVALLRGRRAAEPLSPGPVCPALAVAEGCTDLATCLPTSQWKKLRYYRRRLARRGTAEYVRADEQTLPTQLSALIRLHTARWKERGEAGVLSDPAVQRFHREAASGLLRRGLLRQYVLRLDGRVIAAYYGLHAHGRSHYYLGGFDPAYRKLSPGLLIVGYAFEQAIREQATRFDFLAGQEAYKYAWGARDRPPYRWRSEFRTTPKTGG